MQQIPGSRAVAERASEVGETSRPWRSPLTRGCPGGLGLGAGSEGRLWLQPGLEGSPGWGAGGEPGSRPAPLSAPTASPSPHHHSSLLPLTVCVCVCVRVHVSAHVCMCTSGMQGPHLPLRSGPNKTRRLTTSGLPLQGPPPQSASLAHLTSSPSVSAPALTVPSTHAALACDRP